MRDYLTKRRQEAEQRWAREEELRAQENERRAREEQAKAAREAAIAEVFTSTLASADRPYEEIEVLWGSGHDADSAVWRLKRKAHKRDCDAVLGLRITAVPSFRTEPGTEHVRMTIDTSLLAYGTAVRWIRDTVPPPGGSATPPDDSLTPPGT